MTNLIITTEQTAQFDLWIHIVGHTSHAVGMNSLVQTAVEPNLWETIFLDLVHNLWNHFKWKFSKKNKSFILFYFSLINNLIMKIQWFLVCQPFNISLAFVWKLIFQPLWAVLLTLHSCPRYFHGVMNSKYKFGIKAPLLNK